jgi:hypothetical protein
MRARADGRRRIACRRRGCELSRAQRGTCCHGCRPRCRPRRRPRSCRPTRTRSRAGPCGSGGCSFDLDRSKFGKYLSKGWRAAAGTSLSLIVSSISSQRSVRVDVDLSRGALVRPLDLEGGRDLVFVDPGSGDLHVRGRLRRARGAFRVPIQTMTHRPDGGGGIEPRPQVVRRPRPGVCSRR